MAKLRRAAPQSLGAGVSLRLRAAWMYYGHELTQKDVAERLGISRTSVIRLLDEARRRGEVRISIAEGQAECIDLALRLERVLEIDEAIVVPAAPAVEAAATAVGLALGGFLSGALRDGVRLGVGWGRTLTASLAAFEPPRLDGVTVVSLLGGAIETGFANPVDFSWRLASTLVAPCYLFPAPLIVDSAETKRTLIERCGLDRLFRLAERLDVAVVSVGDIGPASTSLACRLVTPAERDELVASGCVGDVMCNFLDAAGRSVAHPINERVMSVGLDAVAAADHIVIASGGALRGPAILAAIRRIGCNTLVTDEAAAAALLALAAAAPGVSRAG